MHPAALIALGHLLMENAAAGGHPLHVSSAHRALIAEAVAVLHAAAQHVRDRLDAAVRVPGESREVILGMLVAKIIQEQERIEVARAAKPERAT